MSKDSEKKIWTFPAWHNNVPPIFFLIVGPVATVLAIGLVWYYFSPKFTDVGYMPEQPVPYSHALHAGELKIDCRYCHVSVEKTAYAGIPPTATCMNCHQFVKTMSEKLKPIRESYADKNKPVEWVRIHKIADYAYFNHSVHINVGMAVSHATDASIRWSRSTRMSRSAWGGVWNATTRPRNICDPKTRSPSWATCVRKKMWLLQT